MNKPMRRINQQTDDKKAYEMLLKCSHGVLAVISEDGCPYAVPLSYAVIENSIFFHCAKSGHKLDAIKNNKNVSFCAVLSDNIIPEKFTTIYESVIAFGKAEILTDTQRMTLALRALNQKYSGDYPKQGEEEIKKGINGVCIVEIKITHLTGKKAKELL